MTIQECKENVGRNVTYIPFEGCDSKLHEYGVITSVNDRYAFVRYGSDVNSKATDPSDLRLGLNMTREECTKRNHGSPYRTKFWKLIMREIEFRGYDESSGLWRYGFFLFDGRLTYIAQIIQGKIVRWHVNQNTVGQFTGLLDKNGKEIYEGDIVRYYRIDTYCINPDCDSFLHIHEPFLKKIEGVVSYEDGMFLCEDYAPLICFGVSDLQEIRSELDATEENGWLDVNGNTIDESVLGIEVIGNIHDNPELIK